MLSLFRVFALFSFGLVLTGNAREIRGKPITPLKKVDALTNRVNSVKAGASSTARSGDYVNVGFDTLAGYTFETPDSVQSTNGAVPAGQIPLEVKAFDQKN